MKKIIPLSFALLFFLSGCSTTPKALKGNFAAITPTNAVLNHSMDEVIRWSGLVIKTHNQQSRTCFEIIEMENNKSSLRPKRIIPNNSSRFLACKDGFLEPMAFDKRLVTITGNIVAYSKQNVGEYEMEYPVIKTDVIYIWQKQPRIRNNPMLFRSFMPLHFNCHMSLFPGFCF